MLILVSAWARWPRGPKWYSSESRMVSIAQRLSSRASRPSPRVQFSGWLHYQNITKSTQRCAPNLLPSCYQVTNKLPPIDFGGIQGARRYGCVHCGCQRTGCDTGESGVLVNKFWNSGNSFVPRTPRNTVKSAEIHQINMPNNVKATIEF